MAFYISEMILPLGAVGMVIIGLIRVSRAPRRPPPPPWNLIEGECYHEDALKKMLTPIKCADARASFKVVQRVPHSTDTTVCGPDTKSNVYPVPPLVYCLGSPNG